jgi:hypothetical protein
MANDKNTAPKTSYSIEEAAKFLGMRSQYVRTLIRTGKLPSTKVQLSENMWRHEIALAALEARKAAGSTRGKPANGNKYFIHATPVVLARLQAIVAKEGLSITFAPAYDKAKAKAQYLKQKAKKAAAKNGTLKAVVEKK